MKRSNVVGIAMKLLKITTIFFLINSGFNSISFAVEPIIIRFAHSAAADSPKGQMALKFKQLMETAIDDKKIKIEIYPEGLLFDDKQILPAVIKNRAQIVVTPISSLQQFSPRFKLFDLPFLFVSERAASRFLKGEYGDRLLRLMGRSGLIGLGFLNDGMKQLSSSRKMISPKDAENLKFLTSGSDVTNTFFRQINARPIVANLNKAEILLKNKLAEGQESTWSNIRTRGIYNHQAFILESNHAYLADVVLASAEGWESIPGNIKIIIKAELQKAIEYGNTLARKQLINERELILGSGQTEIITMSANQRDEWIVATERVWKKYEDDVGVDLINAAASSR